MLLFRTDETNFLDGTRAGTRLVAGVGVRADFSEFAPDAATLGLWHLHDGGAMGEGTGLADASGNGHPLTNHGAAADENGYRFIRSENDHLLAGPITLASAQAGLTAEAWVRQWQTGEDNLAYFFTLFRATSPTNRLDLYARRSGTSSYIKAALTVDGVEVGSAAWMHADVQSLLDGAQPWHVAAVLESPARLALYVGGVKRAEDVTGILPLGAGSYTLKLGHESGYAPTCVIDEVRLSASARYAATFTPRRLAASGTYDSPTFDTARPGAAWADIAATSDVPAGCSIAWHVRTADALDAGGCPQAAWQPYAGDPAALPEGRYFQWQATLGSSADALATPTVSAVDTYASEAGYNLYRATGAGPDAIDYAEPWARVGPHTSGAVTPALAAGEVHWFAIRATDRDGTETPSAQDELRLELTASGERAADRPAGVTGLVARPRPGGHVSLLWRSPVGGPGATPQAFRIFGDGGTGTMDYDTPLGEVPCRPGQVWYAWTSGQLTSGVEHQLAVRAVASGGTLDEPPAVARVTPDAGAPGEVNDLHAEVTL